MSDALAILRFYAASSLILVFTLPLAWSFFQKSSRHLLLYSRFLGLLLANYTVWLLSALGLLNFSFRGILISLLLLAIGGAFLCRMRGISREEIRQWWRHSWKTALFDEAVFVASLIAFALLVSYYPKIFGTEKNMDFMFLNGLMRGTSIPPHDPWFAGGTINYYYGGYMAMALLGRLSALPPAYTYNLALAFLFASAVALPWAFGTRLSGSRRLGVLAPAMVALMGNLDGFLQVLRVGWPYKIDYFKSSRVIVDSTDGGTINEFPFFSFFHADLHPHVMAIPFVLIFMIALYELLLHLRPVSRANAGDLAGQLLVLSIALGSLGFINGLDLPTFGLLLGGTLVLGFSRIYSRHPKGLLKGLMIGGLLAGVAAAVAYCAYYPFYGMHFVQPTHKEGLLGVSIFRSDLGEFLTVFHLQLFLVIAYLAAHLAEVGRRSHPQLFRLALWSLAALFFLAFALTGYVVVALLIVLLLPLLHINLTRCERPNHLFTATMLTLAVAILLGCEFVHVRDDYGEKLQRMNTLFKFHYQAWILFGLSAPIVFRRLRRTRALPQGVKILVQTAALLLLAMNLVYPIGVSWSRVVKPGLRADLRPLRTLDGMEYLRREHPSEARAIAWLNEHVEGTPVILEYPGKKAYSYESRVSTNTGLPTLVGWINHESIWRKRWAEADPESRRLMEEARVPISSWSLMAYRQRIADRIYQEADFERIAPLIRQFNIEYIYVGELERANYPAAGLNKFEFSCERVYEGGNVAIYRVPDRYREINPAHARPQSR